MRRFQTPLLAGPDRHCPAARPADTPLRHVFSGRWPPPAILPSPVAKSAKRLRRRLRPSASRGSTGPACCPCPRRDQKRRRLRAQRAFHVPGHELQGLGVPLGVPFFDEQLGERDSRRVGHGRVGVTLQEDLQVFANALLGAMSMCYCNLSILAAVPLALDRSATHVAKALLTRSGSRAASCSVHPILRRASRSSVRRVTSPSEQILRHDLVCAAATARSRTAHVRKSLRPQRSGMSACQ